MIGDFYDGDSFLSVLGTRQRFRELRTTWACGKVRTSSVQAFKNKKLLLRGRLWRRPSPANSRADTTKFRKRLKHVERGNHVEKLRRKSLVLQFQKFHINIDVPTHQY